MAEHFDWLEANGQGSSMMMTTTMTTMMRSDGKMPCQSVMAMVGSSRDKHGFMETYGVGNGEGDDDNDDANNDDG
jgi:hypothetical protein